MGRLGILTDHTGPEKAIGDEKSDNCKIIIPTNIPPTAGSSTAPEFERDKNRHENIGHVSHTIKAHAIGLTVINQFCPLQNELLYSRGLRTSAYRDALSTKQKCITYTLSSVLRDTILSRLVQ
jgi:hypothetical protein